MEFCAEGVDVAGCATVQALLVAIPDDKRVAAVNIQVQQGVHGGVCG